ncbi:hypothetical protein CHS0354_032133 [Potamilus streckersoni]|uniref:B box-type domain-containing protein n=1 Tax=Potamilus streckersoni TaxID=2493646 RepID=A0AAE0SFY1_9BIVA|nr:hypothetical protein CHS0354_032133 [Potamilus streckersoni]
MADHEDYIRQPTGESTVPSSVPVDHSNGDEIDHSVPQPTEGTTEVEHPASLPVQFSEVTELSVGEVMVPLKEEAKEYIEIQPTLDVEDLVKKATSGTHFCSLHMLEKFEENIVCVTCEELICPLCMRDQHREHQIVSLNAVTEFHASRNALQEHAERLASYQKTVSEMYKTRVQLVAEIQMSARKLNETVQKSIEELIAEVKEKHDEIVAYVSNYEASCVKKLSVELQTLCELENLANPITKAVNASLMRFDPQWKAQYSLLVEKVEDACQKYCDGLASIPNNSPGTITLPEEKFSKLAPSIITFQQICGRLHPEATNIVVNKVKVKKESEEYNTSETSDSDHQQVEECPVVETPKKVRQLELIEMERNFTKIAQLPQQRQPTLQVEVIKKMDGDGVIATYSRAKPKSKRYTPAQERALRGLLPEHLEFRLVSFDILTIEEGCGVMIKTGSWLSDRTQILIGKLTNIGITEESQTDTDIFTIRIFNDPLKRRKFEFAQDRILKEICSTNEIVCHFRLDKSVEMSNELYRELVSLKHIASPRMFDQKFLSGSKVRENCFKLSKPAAKAIVMKVTPNKPKETVPAPPDKILPVGKRGELVGGYVPERRGVNISPHKKVEWKVHIPDFAEGKKMSVSTLKRTGGVPIVHEENIKIEEVNKPSQNSSVTSNKQVLNSKDSVTSTPGKPQVILVSLVGENKIEHEAVKIDPDQSKSTRKRKGGRESDQLDEPRRKKQAASEQVKSAVKKHVKATIKKSIRTPIKKRNNSENGTPVKKENLSKSSPPVKKGNLSKNSTPVKKGNITKNKTPIKKGNITKISSPVLKKGNTSKKVGPTAKAKAPIRRVPKRNKKKKAE